MWRDEVAGIQIFFLEISGAFIGLQVHGLHYGHQRGRASQGIKCQGFVHRSMKPSTSIRVHEQYTFWGSPESPGVLCKKQLILNFCFRSVFFQSRSQRRDLSVMFVLDLGMIFG